MPQDQPLSRILSNLRKDGIAINEKLKESNLATNLYVGDALHLLSQLELQSLVEDRNVGTEKRTLRLQQQLSDTLKQLKLVTWHGNVVKPGTKFVSDLESLVNAEIQETTQKEEKK